MVRVPVQADVFRLWESFAPYSGLPRCHFNLHLDAQKMCKIDSEELPCWARKVMFFLSFECQIS